MFIEYKIDSSYYCNNKGKKDITPYFYPQIGQTLYDYVIDTKPRIILEFGVLHGFSTCCMAQALSKNRLGKIHAYDLWEGEKFNHGQHLPTVQNTLTNYGLDKFVDLKYGDIFTCLKTVNLHGVDIIHIDINNDGDKLLKAVNLLKDRKYQGSILFEGGIVERDNCWWMKEFNKKPLNSIKQTFNYDLLNSNYPGLSKIQI